MRNRCVSSSKLSYFLLYVFWNHKTVNIMWNKWSKFFRFFYLKFEPISFVITIISKNSADDKKEAHNDAK